MDSIQGGPSSKVNLQSVSNVNIEDAQASGLKELRKAALSEKPNLNGGKVEGVKMGLEIGGKEFPLPSVLEGLLKK